MLLAQAMTSLYWSFHLIRSPHTRFDKGRPDCLLTVKVKGYGLPVVAAIGEPVAGHACRLTGFAVAGIERLAISFDRNRKLFGGYVAIKSPVSTG